MELIRFFFFIRLFQVKKLQVLLDQTTCILFIDQLLTNTRFSHKILRITCCDYAFVILLQCMTGNYLG